MTDDKQIRVEKEGRVVAQATVSADDDGQGRAQVHVAAGQLPVGTRREVVEAVHEAVTEHHTHHLTATVPLGDVELVQGIRNHLDGDQIRAAGATSIITGEVKPS